MYFQNCFIAVNLMIDNRFGRAAGVGLGSLLVIPFLFLEHCFHFLLLEHFHFLVLELFRLFFIFLPHDFFQFLNPLLPALSYSLLRFCLLHVQFLTFGTPSDNSHGLFHFCPSFILCFVVVCNNIQPHFYRSFSRPTTSYKIVQTSKPSIKATSNQFIQAYQNFFVSTNF